MLTHSLTSNSADMRHNVTPIPASHKRTIPGAAATEEINGLQWPAACGGLLTGFPFRFITLQTLAEMRRKRRARNRCGDGLAMVRAGEGLRGRRVCSAALLSVALHSCLRSRISFSLPVTRPLAGPASRAAKVRLRPPPCTSKMRWRPTMWLMKA